MRLSLRTTEPKPRESAGRKGTRKWNSHWGRDGQRNGFDLVLRRLKVTHARALVVDRRVEVVVVLGKVGRGRVVVLVLSVSSDDGSLQSARLGGIMVLDDLWTGAEDLDGVVAVSHEILVRDVRANDDGRRRCPDVANDLRVRTREDGGCSGRGTVVERAAETVDLRRRFLKELRGRLRRERRGGSDEIRSIGRRS